MRQTDPSKLRSFAGQVLWLLAGLQCVQLVFVIGAFFAAQILLQNIAQDRADQAVTSLSQEIIEDLILQKFKSNQEAFDFLIYDIIQSKRLDYAGFVAADHLEEFLQQNPHESDCDVGSFARGQACRLLGMDKSSGAIKLEFDGKNLGYLIQRVGYDQFRDESDLDWLWKVGAALLLAFALNIFGLFAFFPRKMAKEIRSLQDKITGHATETKSADVSIRELAQIAQALDEAAEVRARSAKLEREAARTEALVTTTQMFAHDVRKPFSLLRRGIELLTDVRSADEFRSLSGLLKDDLQRQELMVGGLLDDMLELGKSGHLRLQAQSLNQALLSSLKNAAIIVREVEAEIVWELNHRHVVVADSRGMSRVLVNIFVNALEALRQNPGKLMIRSQQQGESSISLAITNTGSYLPQEVAQRVFEPFFTHGKRDGTGLGLAAAHKLVKEMNGSIAIHSDEADHKVTIEMILVSDGRSMDERMAMPISIVQLRNSSLEKFA